MISDYHNNHYIKDKIISKAKEFMPDLICIPGDMTVCRENAKADNLKSAKLLVELSNIAPVFYSYGNHELGMSLNKNNMRDNFDEYLSIINESDNIHLLDNSKIQFEDIEIAGLTLSKDYYKRLKSNKLGKEAIEGYLGECKMPCVLLAHTPEYFEDYSDWGAKLILSGHNHGGLVRLPAIGGVLSSRLHIFPKYDFGKYEKDESIMFISNGAGSHTPKIRFNNMVSIQQLVIKKK